MSDFSSQEQWKRGENPASRAGVSNLIPFKPGQSGNPGGVRKGTVIVSEAYKRLGAMPLEQLRAYQPRSAIEHGIQQAVLRAAEAKDWQAAHAALKEIADRTEGKALQRRIDLTEAEVLSRARMGFASLQRFAAKVVEQYPLVSFTEQELIEDVLAGIDAQYHEAVIRELEVMAG